MKTPILFWTARLVAAIIMVQTLYFKFTAPESVFIFSTVGMEPWGRWLVGFLELVASVMLFIPATIWLGSILAIGLMAGALGMHLTLLGIEVQGDGGQLFIYALVVLICTLYSFWKSRQAIPAGLQKFLPSFLK
ncbi:MAG: DoxX family protein [Cyclobacteriaceae bacterium]|nr:MAG: DoxX family protein [Cyclobacteriaceae bacterium]